MQSPFPGMDPYIEECGLFEDFHQSLIDEIARALARSLPPRYVVRKGERPYVVLNEKERSREHVFQPDVGVVAHASSPAPAAPIAVQEAEAAADSISMRAFVAEEFRESFVEIYLTEPNRELVTCIEVLSPSNKRRGSKGWKTYLRKRRGLLSGSANLLEIDLLRRGAKMPMVDPWPESPYTLLVARRDLAPACRVWPAHFMRALPIVPVPLLRPDLDVPLNFQPMIEKIYEEFRYESDIDYTRPLTPPLRPEETTWLAEQLRQLPASS